MSEHFANTLEAEGGDLKVKVNRAIWRSLGRPATPEELSALTEYADRFGMNNVCRVIFNLSEFLYID